MTGHTKIASIGLGLLVSLGLLQAGSVPILSVDPSDTVVIGVTNILMLYFIFALVVERACEVVMIFLTTLGIVPEKSTEKGNPGRALVAQLVCLAFSVGVSLAGLRLCEMILHVAVNETPEFGAYFGLLDAGLTAFILAGGSEGVHKILKRVLNADPSPST